MINNYLWEFLQTHTSTGEEFIAHEIYAKIKRQHKNHKLYGSNINSVSKRLLELRKKGLLIQTGIREIYKIDTAKKYEKPIFIIPENLIDCDYSKAKQYVNELEKNLRYN